MTIDFKAAKTAAKSKIASAINSSKPAPKEESKWVVGLKIASDVVVASAISCVVGLAASKATDALMGQAKKEGYFHYL